MIEYWYKISISFRQDYKLNLVVWSITQTDMEMMAVKPSWYSLLCNTQQPYASRLPIASVGALMSRKGSSDIISVLCLTSERPAVQDWWKDLAYILTSRNFTQKRTITHRCQSFLHVEPNSDLLGYPTPTSHSALERRTSFERGCGLAMILWAKFMFSIFGKFQSSKDATYHLPQAQEEVAPC